jgi:single-stranded-DNA-specific exonuclease
MKECGCTADNVSATTIGFMLAPRINAAGRMGQINWAVDLFLTHDPVQAEHLARSLCDLNRQRQQVEGQIYNDAVSMLPAGQPPEAIVLADETWHQGVVGIVASRMAEEYCCPTFLICLDGDHGKASSRSFGGFNLFASLTALSELLESYGGHELAAGFTISRQNIPQFREKICQRAADYYCTSGPRTVLDIDCAITPELLTVRGIDSLSALEPCGNGCPKPVLMMKNLIAERISLVGNGRHMRLRLRSGHHTVNAIYFSANPQAVSIEPGDLVDVAFHPQVNEFRGERSVQMNVLDIRPSCGYECSPEMGGYAHIAAGALTADEAAFLLPERATLGAVWRYLAGLERTVQEDPLCLCRKIVRWANQPLSLGQMFTCLDIFRDVGLLRYTRQHKDILIDLTPGDTKADLSQSQTMQKLLHAKES